MGAGIAYVSASAGLDVVLIDRDMTAAEKGKAHAAKLLGDQVAKGRMKAAERDETLARIRPGTDYAAMAGCDLVIEAVFEDRDIKRSAIQQAEVHLGADTTFASNTSTLPITSLAQNAAKPENFIGIHFFSPVEKMLLVEIILGEKTSETALATAMDFVRRIKKTPIVVNDSRGFYANRCVANYLLEGQLMLMEGIPPAMIENLARQAGMPVGPLSFCLWAGDDGDLQTRSGAQNCAGGAKRPWRGGGSSGAGSAAGDHGGDAWPSGPQKQTGVL